MGAALRQYKALRAENLVPDDEETRLQFILDATYRRVLLEVHFLVQDSLPIDPATFRLADESTARLLQHAATRVVDITETTRNAIRDKLIAGQAAGLSTFEIEQSIENLFTVTWAGRAEMIASTEIGEAQRLAAIDRYTATGLVDRVKISDANRGTNHTAVCLARAGTTVPLDQAPQLDHPRCLIGGQVVWAANVETAFTRWFEGEVIVLRTAANDLLTVTPNHPILSGRGWVAAGELTERDYVFRSGDGEGVTRLLDPDHDHRPALIEQVADALGPAGGGTTAAVPGTPIDFHGDGAYGDVNIIRPDRLAWDSADRQQLQQRAFTLALVCQRALFALRNPAPLVKRLDAPARGVVGGAGEGLPVFGGGVGVAERAGLGNGSDRQATFAPRGVEIADFGSGFCREKGTAFASEIAHMQRVELGVMAPLVRYPLFHDRPTPGVKLLAQYLGIDSDTGTDLAQGLASLMAATRITQILRRPFCGHVYNLQTKAGWYVAENIITHNCSLVLIPVLREGVV